MNEKKDKEGFMDEDLSKIRDLSCNHTGACTEIPDCLYGIRGLIARLEAAEALLAHIECCCADDVLYDTWKKSKGE